MAFTPLQNPPKQDNPEQTLLMNVQALLTQVTGATLDNNEVEQKEGNNLVKRKAVYLDSDGNLHLRMQGQAGVDLLKNHIKEPAFSKNGIFFQGNELILTGMNVMSFCNNYCGLSIEDTKALFKNAQVNEQQRKKVFSAYKLNALVKQALPIEEVKLLSNEEMEQKAKSLGFADSAANAYKELYTTEKSYIDALRRIGPNEIESLLKVYDELSPKEKKSFISKQEFSNLLNSFSKLESLQMELLARIQENPLNIAQMLPKLQEHYSQYINQYQAAMAKGGIPAMFNDLYANDPQFKGQQLGAFLIQPTQRIMRYGLLYQELLKQIPANSPQKAEYEKLLLQIGAATQVVNVGVQAINLEKSDMVLTLDIDKSEAQRRRVKGLLRGFDSHESNLQEDEKERKISNQANMIGLQGYVIEEKKKTRLERVKNPKEAEFIIKSAKEGEPVFKVIINEGKISIKELKAGNVNETAYQQQLRDLNHLMEALKGSFKNQPVVSSKNLESAVALKQIGVNNKLINYSLSAGVKKLIEAKVSNEAASYDMTTSKSIPIMKIDYDDAKSKFYKEGIIKQIGDQALKQERDKLRHDLQSIIDEGTVVPELRIKNKGLTTSQSDIGYDGETDSPNPIKITTTQPLLAIKQFEAILAMGFTPKFESKAAMSVEKYVKENVSSNFEAKLMEEPGQTTQTERQINIEGPRRDDGSIDGAQVLRRIIIAAQNGLLVNLPGDTKVALKNYVADLNAKELARLCEVNFPKGPEPVMMVRNLLELGIMPIIPTPAKSLKESVKKGEKLNIIKIDSGNVEQDFKILKTALGQMGMQVSVDVQRIKEHVKDSPQVTYIDLSNFSDSEQLKQAQQLAHMGVSCMIKAKVPPDTNLLITSSNAKHAVQMFEKALNQGFVPKFNSSMEPLMRQLLEVTPQGVKIEGNDPKVVFDKVKQCMEIGLMPVLSDSQQKILREYAVKNTLSLTVQGHHPSTIINNIGLANKLNIEPKVTTQAEQIYEANISSSDKPHSVAIYPFEKEKTRFFFFKTKVVDHDRTLAHVKRLQDSQIYFHNSSEMDAAMIDVKATIEKKRFFGQGLTKTANELREKFFKPFMECQGNDEVRRMAFQVQMKGASANTTTQSAVVGGARVQPMISTSKPTAGPSSISAQNPKAPPRRDDPSKPKI